MSPRPSSRASPTGSPWTSSTTRASRGVAVAHEDPAKVALAHRDHRALPARPDAPRDRLRPPDGPARRRSNVTDELFEAAAQDDEHLEVIGRSASGPGCASRSSPASRSWARSASWPTAGPVRPGAGRLRREPRRPDRAGDLDVALVPRGGSLQERSRRHPRRGHRLRPGQPPDLVRQRGRDGPARLRGRRPGRRRGRDRDRRARLDRPARPVEPLVNGALDAQTATLSFRHSDGRTVPVEALFQHVVRPARPRSWWWPATSAIAWRPRRTSAAWPNRSTPGRPSSTRSSGRSATASSSASRTGGSAWRTRGRGRCSPT